MKRPHVLPWRLALSAGALLVLAGCASVGSQQNLDRVNQEVGPFVGEKLTLVQSQKESDERNQAAERLLAQPLEQPQAVQLALVNDPGLQALLASGWSNASDAAQSGRIANPVFGFTRLTGNGGLEIDRALSFGLLDLITLPARQGIATKRIDQAQLQLASDVVGRITRVRQAWVRAVAAQQALAYAHQVHDSAQAGAELARRMEGVGNFNRLDRAREQVFAVDSATQLARAQLQQVAAREALVRLLGLDEAQAMKLKLPERLPDLPAKPLDAQAVAALATTTRLDIRLAQASFDGAAKAQGLTRATSFTDVGVGGVNKTTFDNAQGTRATQQGWEFALSLPLFDWGGMQRGAMNARTLAAANELQATLRDAGSSLREDYAAYRTAYDLSRHYRDQVVPLRKVISDEMQLRYNGMLASTFELLADQRDRVNTVLGALDAQQQFWLADAALRASVIGRPGDAALAPVGATNF